MEETVAWILYTILALTVTGVLVYKMKTDGNLENLG
jgi:hypothetical protein